MIRWFNLSRICGAPPQHCKQAAGSQPATRMPRSIAHSIVSLGQWRMRRRFSKPLSRAMRYCEFLELFNHTIDQLTSGVGDVPTALRIGALSNAMGRFTSEPRPSIGAEVTSLLDHLIQDSASEQLRHDLTTLVPHGRLIVVTLPELDGILSRLLSAPTAERARSVQD